MSLYRALLYLYPASFRNEYAIEMCEVFRQRRLDAGNVLALLALWIETLFDIFGNAVRVHLDILAQDLRYTVRSSKAPQVSRSRRLSSPRWASARAPLRSPLRTTS